jgi:hypothetical protein
MSDGDESFLAEICFGGGVWKNQEIKVGKSFEDVKEWAVKLAQEAHPGYDIDFLKIEKYRPKFMKYVDVDANLQAIVPDGEQIRVNFEVRKVSHYATAAQKFTKMWISDFETDLQIMNVR